MTFTELEYVLMIAVVALLWRNCRLDQSETEAVNAANKYAYILRKIGKGEGILKKDGTDFVFVETNEPTK